MLRIVMLLTGLVLIVSLLGCASSKQKPANNHIRSDNHSVNVSTKILDF